MNSIIDHLPDSDIFFVVPDVKRAIGLEQLVPRFHIVCTYSQPLVHVLKKQGISIYCLEDEGFVFDKTLLNTGKLLEHKSVISFIKAKSQNRPYIMYFKPSRKIDYLIKENNYLAIGNSAQFSRYEDKIFFFDFQKKYVNTFSIPSQIGKFSDFTYSELVSTFGEEFVIQLGFGWAGKTTFFISNEKTYKKLETQYNYTTIKVSKKIQGITLLNNCCIHNGSVLVGPAAIQINGIDELYDNPSVTCGRQWADSFVEPGVQKQINEISHIVGNVLADDGYQGFFGIDFMLDKTTSRLYISEVNARLTASSAFYTKIETGMNCSPLMLYHLFSYLHIPLNPSYANKDTLNASQVILRSEKITPEVSNFPDLGVIEVSDSNKKAINKNYNPESLKVNQYIVMKNPQSVSHFESEIGRIETKEAVLDTSFKLTTPVKALLKLN